MRAVLNVAFFFIVLSMSETSAQPCAATLEAVQHVEEFVVDDRIFKDPAVFAFGKAVTGMNLGEVSRATHKLQHSLEKLDLDTFMGELNSHLSELTVRPVENYAKTWCQAILCSFLRVAAITPMHRHFNEFYERFGVLTFEMQNAQDSTMLIFDVAFDGNMGEAYQKLLKSEPDGLFHLNPSFRTKHLVCVMMSFDLKTYRVDDWKFFWRGKIPEMVTTTTTTTTSTD